MRRRWLGALAAVGLALAACGPHELARVEFEVVPASSGLRFRHELPGGTLDNLAKSAMGGFAVIDYDGDGLADVFCVNGGWDDKLGGGGERPTKTAHHRLFHNLGGFRFEDVTGRAFAGVERLDGFGLGACIGDIDGDGRPDLYVAQYRRPLLLRNRGDGTFEDVAERAGIDVPFAAGAAFLDYDHDGDLDLFAGQYVDLDDVEMTGMAHAAQGDGVFPGPGAYKTKLAKLYRNRGDGTFEDLTQEAGLRKPGKAMGVSATDVDGDGWTDVVQANDAMQNFVWRNKGDGTFVDVGATSGLAFGRDAEDRASMGVTFADIDGDGRRDVLIPDTRGGAVYQGRDPWFSDRSAEWGLAGMSLGRVGWCDVAFDPDCDGLMDLYRVHGDLRTLEPQTSFLIRNLGPDSDRKGSENPAQFLRAEPGISGIDGVAEVDATGRAALACDLDNDGREDLLVSGIGGPLRVFRNVTKSGGAWVRVRLVGTGKNPLAIGAIVRGRAGKRRLVGEVTGSTGYISGGDLRVHFGLGDASSLDDVVIRWPDGTETKSRSLAAGRDHVVERR
ncbi:MAG: CRTAC1 family protein [Planctomycetes bacterium]|nr:CRTAC1 family protein [Planctomycetota bacterium]